MVIMVIVSFFQSFDNHDYILELALLFNNENQGYEPYKLLWFCFVPITTQHWFEYLDQKYP